MSRDTFDAILASSPQGPVAGRVVSGGVHYDPKINFGTRRHWTAPPPTKPFMVRPDRPSLVGIKFGRLTVVGFLGKLNPKKKELWLVRCVCGDYEARHSNAVTTGNPDDCCQVCLDFRVKQRRYVREGARPITDFFVPVPT